MSTANRRSANWRIFTVCCNSFNASHTHELKSGDSCIEPEFKVECETREDRRFAPLHPNVIYLFTNSHRADQLVCNFKNAEIVLIYHGIPFCLQPNLGSYPTLPVAGISLSQGTGRSKRRTPFLDSPSAYPATGRSF